MKRTSSRKPTKAVSKKPTKKTGSDRKKATPKQTKPQNGTLRLTTCDYCGTQNRVAPHAENVRPVCGRCKKPLGGCLDNSARALTEVRQPVILARSYDEALRVGPLLEALSHESEATLFASLKAHKADALVLGLQGASWYLENGQMVAKFSREGARLLGAGELTIMRDAAGRHIPMLRDGAGRIVENAKGIGALSKGTRIAANLMAAAVTLAHIVSGADLAKKMDALGKKIDFLVAARRIDQVARVEGVYRQARELLNQPITDATRFELHQLGRVLFEVRAQWRGEMEFHVNGLQREESKNWFIGFFRSFGRQGRDNVIADKVAACDAELHLINTNIAIHLALSQAAGTLETFLQVSLPEELKALAQVRELIWSRRGFILEKHHDLRSKVDDAHMKFGELIDLYRPMAMERVHPTHLLG